MLKLVWYKLILFDDFVFYGVFFIGIVIRVMCCWCLCYYVDDFDKGKWMCVMWWRMIFGWKGWLWWVIIGGGKYWLVDFVDCVVLVEWGLFEKLKVIVENWLLSVVFGNWFICVLIVIIEMEKGIIECCVLVVCEFLCVVLFLD